MELIQNILIWIVENIEWVIFAILLSTFTYLYFWKRKTFDKYKSFIEIVVILFTASFAVYQVRSSTNDFNQVVDRMEDILESAEKSTSSLDNVEQSLSALPQHIDTFSTLIKSLNEIVASQKNELSGTLSGFNESILGFKSAVDSMVKRFNRKPKLKIDLLTWKNDTSTTITSIVVTNIGSLLADMHIIRLQIPTEDLIKFELTGGRKDTEFGIFSNYQATFPEMLPIIANPQKPRKFDCNIVLKNKNFDLAVIVYYRAEFGNDGSAEQIFSFYRMYDISIKR